LCRASTSSYSALPEDVDGRVKAGIIEKKSPVDDLFTNQFVT